MKHGNCGRHETYPEGRRGIARHYPARGPVGRPLIRAEKGLEIRLVGALWVPWSKCNESGQSQILRWWSLKDGEDPDQWSTQGGAEYFQSQRGKV